MKHVHWIALLLLGVLLSACKPAAEEPVMGTVSGTLTYRERMALSPEAVATVSLRDVSLADAPAKIIGETKIAGPGQVPIAFEIEYDPAAIDERMTYSLHAQIHDRGRLLFTSDTHTPVLTHGAGNTAELLLVQIRVPTVSPPEMPESTSTEPAGERLAGFFTYMADAAVFEDCRTRKVFPVAMEGAYIDLERAYLNSRIEAGKPLLVNVTGRFLERPAMEGDKPVVSLVVDAFEAVLPEQSCVPPVDEALENTYWKLLEVDGVAVNTPEGRKEAHMILRPDEARVGGNAGCNNFFGGYEVNGESLSFGQVGATMMACPDGMDTEQAFLAALGSTDHYEISGLILTLYQGEKPLAKFEAVHLP